MPSDKYLRNKARRERLKADGRCPICGGQPNPDRVMCENCLSKRRGHNSQNAKSSRAWRTKLRDKVLNHYGTECKCCGENTNEFLTIDHINGNGRQHREKIGRSAFYRWLEKNGFPEGYQTLCFNCNAARYLFGECPHQHTKK